MQHTVFCHPIRYGGGWGGSMSKSLTLHNSYPCIHTCSHPRMYIEGLAIGNITQSEVEGMAARLRALLTAQLGTRPIFPSQVRGRMGGACALLAAQLGTRPIFPSQVRWERRVMLRGGGRRVPECSDTSLPLCHSSDLSPPLPSPPAQCRDFRTVRLAEGRTAVFVEPGPNPADANSAVVLAYQVCGGVGGRGGEACLPPSTPPQPGVLAAPGREITASIRYQVGPASPPPPPLSGGPGRAAPQRPAAAAGAPGQAGRLQRAAHPAAGERGGSLSAVMLRIILPPGAAQPALSLFCPKAPLLPRLPPSVCVCVCSWATS